MRAILKLALMFGLLLSLAGCSSKFLTYNGPEVTRVVVFKEMRRMYLLNGKTVLRNYRIDLGFAPSGDKTVEGDGRTPEGSYTLDYKKENSAFYRSMHIDYPNQQDVANAKAKNIDPGGFIMIHGQKSLNTKQALIMQKFNWTDGCIAITNAEMDEFMNLVDTGTKIQIQW